MHVREYSVQQAKAHIKTLLSSAGLKRISPQVLDRFLKIIEIPIPFFIQVLVRESLNEMERQSRKTLDEAMVEAAYEHGVLAVYNRTYGEGITPERNLWLQPLINTDPRCTLPKNCKLCSSGERPC